jgi:error-prone DNA polymerase
MTEAERMLAEQEVMGVSTGPQIMSFYRDRLAANGILSSRQLAACPNGKHVRVAGLLVVHQAPPTARGFHFLTLETEDKMLNIVVRPGVYKRFRQLLRTAHLLVVTGTVQHEMGVTNVLANNIAQLDNLKNNGSQEG